MKLRRIAPLDVSGITPADLTQQTQFDIDLVDPRDLWVEDEAQRDFVKRSKDLALQVVAGFDYAKFVVPTCARVNGKLLVINGQTTVTACASHPDIRVIPVLVVNAPKLEQRAGAFVSHSRDRVAATPGQVWRGLLAAGDPEALAIQRVCEAAGIILLPYAPAGSAYKVRETIAIAAIKALIKRHAPEKAALILAALGDADLAPITALFIRVAETLMCDPEYAADFDIDRLSASIRALGPKAMAEAKELAAAKQLPLWRALVAVIYRHRKGRTPTAAAPAAPPPSPARRIIDRTPPSGVVPLGEPGPGRSALDRKRAHA